MECLSISQAQRDRIITALPDIPWPSNNAMAPSSLLQRCPMAGQTPLVTSPSLAQQAGVGNVFIKDERSRMGMGSFKALGAAYVIAHDAQHGCASGQTYVTASAGNHGLSVAAGAAAFGARAVIYLAKTVPEGFAARLRAHGAEVRREGDTYEQSMQAAAEAATANQWALLSDSSWPGYLQRPHRLMEGYLVLMQEAAEQMPAAPTHLFLQAGVGGLAGACAAFARATWGQGPRIIVVEPMVATALYASIRAGAAVTAAGPESAMGRLDCKEPSLIALKALARDADFFMTITEEEGAQGDSACRAAGLPTTPSGAGGIAGMLAAAAQQDDIGLGAASRVLTILSEQAETGSSHATAL